VQALVERQIACDANHALELGNLLLERGYFHHVTRDHEFKNKKLFYRFSESELSHGEVPIECRDTWHLVTEGPAASEARGLGKAY
jgi:hypothetical protein